MVVESSGYIEYRDIDDLLFDLNILVDDVVTDSMMEEVRRHQCVTVRKKSKNGTTRVIVLTIRK